MDKFHIPRITSEVFDYNSACADVYYRIHSYCMPHYISHVLDMVEVPWFCMIIYEISFYILD